jgi:hypothetical protein
MRKPHKIVMFERSENGFRSGGWGCVDSNLRSVKLGVESGMATNIRPTSPVRAIRRPKKSAKTVRARARLVDPKATARSHDPRRDSS